MTPEQEAYEKLVRVHADLERELATTKELSVARFELAQKLEKACAKLTEEKAILESRLAVKTYDLNRLVREIHTALGQVPLDGEPKHPRDGLPGTEVATLQEVFEMVTAAKEGAPFKLREEAKREEPTPDPKDAHELEERIISRVNVMLDQIRGGRT